MYRLLAVPGLFVNLLPRPLPVPYPFHMVVFFPGGPGLFVHGQAPSFLLSVFLCLWIFVCPNFFMVWFHEEQCLMPHCGTIFTAFFLVFFLGPQDGVYFHRYWVTCTSSGDWGQSSLQFLDLLYHFPSVVKIFTLQCS